MKLKHFCTSRKANFELWIKTCWGFENELTDLDGDK